MREREVLEWLDSEVPAVGDDCAIIPFRDTNLVFTTDMLWQETDFPAGVSDYAIGWRAAAVSLSDIAAMGAKPLGLVVALGAPEFDKGKMREMLHGIQDCCARVGSPYVGGDLSKHSQLTLVSSALGEVANPVRRSGSDVGDLVCVSGELGRTAMALKLFAQNNVTEANELFCFTPRVAEGRQLAPFASSMMDISDGLARSLYQMSGASGHGFKVFQKKIPVMPQLSELERRELTLYTGEDFELLYTLSKANLKLVEQATSCHVIGEVVPEGVWLDVDGRVVELQNRGYEH